MAWNWSDKEERKRLMSKLGNEYREKCIRDSSPKGKHSKMQPYVVSLL